MAHPYQEHREVHAGRKAAHARCGGKMARGGKAHSDESADRSLFKRMMAQHEKGEMKIEGRASGGRLDKMARGGKAKGKGKKGNHVNIAIVAPHGSPSDVGAAPGGLPTPSPRPSPGLPPGGPPGLPPGGPPPGMGPKPPGMMKKGGKVKGYKHGGYTGGGDSGVGRLEKVAKYGKRAKSA